jgi:hemerythrin
MARLRKVHVTTGVSWVEAPELDLYVLCGCPADAVKHLMRRGLIVETESKGVSYETGPNAILLSDVMVQNGVFCNLAEFPVLQMLYRQGMMLPGHPNNQGGKPLLIGARDVVEAQMRYIHRGNYGLISKDEILAAGVPPEQADEMYLLKLAFAFGAIRPPQDLIETLPLGGAPVTLKGGVTLRRTGHNLFEFALDDERVSVDLNLPPGETYAPPYMLGVHRIERAYFAVVHAGEGDGWDVNRPCMSSIIIFQGRIYLIDAGPNLQYSLTALGIGINEVEGIFHTHAHDDHFAGLTTLMRADRRLKYYAAPLVRASVMKKLAALLTIEEESFTDYFEVHDLAQDQWNDVDGLEVKPIYSPHPVETTVLLFRALWHNGYRTYAHWADIASRETLTRMVSSGEEPGITPAFLERVLADYTIPADVKKIDIGGGLIHGQAQDFREDSSRKIVLAHTARALTVAEKEIGSGAPFGTAEVLIAGSQDFIWRAAFQILAGYFPDTPRHELRLLINCPILSCNPETILLQPNQPVDQIYLLVGGTVEMIDPGANVGGVLSAGVLVGEMAALEGVPAGKTYRAASFVQALVIPSDLYREFIRRNGLLSEVMAQAERRNFLRSTWLCAEALTETTLHRLAKGLTSHAFRAGEMVPARRTLAFLRSGTADLCIGEETVEPLSRGTFWGEETALFDTPPLFTVRAREAIRVYTIEPEMVRSVPVMRWKLLESYQRRMNIGMSDTGKAESVRLHWRDEYSVNVQSLDLHHRNLIVHANAVFDAVNLGQDDRALEDAFAQLMDVARLHFRDEEELLERYEAPGLEPHRHKHERLLEQLDIIRQRYRQGGADGAIELATALREWVVGHILADDRRAAAVLNAKGVF